MRVGHRRAHRLAAPLLALALAAILIGALGLRPSPGTAPENQRLEAPKP